MGQRLAVRSKRRNKPRSKTADQPRNIEVSIFATSLGWIGFAGSEKTVVALTMGHASAAEVRSALSTRVPDGGLEERDWYPELRRGLEQYTQGRFVDLSKFRLDLGQTTPYRKQVLEAACRIPYGKTVTYQQLAVRTRNPRAARAVGSAMANNPIALLVPCHRVVAAGGIGGFSARHGVELKQRLLEMEAMALRSR